MKRSAFKLDFLNKRIHDDKLETVGQSDGTAFNWRELDVETGVSFPQNRNWLIHTASSHACLFLALDNSLQELLTTSLNVLANIPFVGMHCCQGWANSKSCRTWKSDRCGHISSDNYLHAFQFFRAKMFDSCSITRSKILEMITDELYFGFGING